MEPHLLLQFKYLTQEDSYQIIYALKKQKTKNLGFFFLLIEETRLPKNFSWLA